MKVIFEIIFKKKAALIIRRYDIDYYTTIELVLLIAETEFYLI